MRNFGEELKHLYGELQVMVKYDLYLEVVKRYDKPMENNIAGIDVNVDRVNLVVINREGDIIWIHTARFPQVVTRNYPRKSAWRIIRLTHAPVVTDISIDSCYDTLGSGPACHRVSWKHV